MQQCSSRARNGEKHRLLCSGESYDTTGHWRAAYVFGSPQQSTRRFAPYLSYTTVGPLDKTEVPKAEELRGIFPHKLRVRFGIVGHRRLLPLENRKSWDPNDYDIGSTQRNHDEVELVHSLMGIRGWGWVRHGSGFVLLGVSWLAWLASRGLTVMYWATRSTSTGISVWGTSLIVVGEVLRSFAFTWDYYRSRMPGPLFWIAIWGILLLPELLQLRVIVPKTLERQGQKMRVVDIPRTARERRSARADLTERQLGILGAVLTAAAYLVYVRPTRVLRASHDRTHRDQYQYPYLGEEVVSKMSLLPLAQALVTTGQIAQLVVNYRSRTFAGNYALTCAFKVISLIGFAAPFVAKKTYNDGLYVATVSQGVLVLAEAAQAWWYPRVEQEDDVDSVEL